MHYFLDNGSSLNKVPRSRVIHDRRSWAFIRPYVKNIIHVNFSRESRHEIADLNESSNWKSSNTVFSKEKFIDSRLHFNQGEIGDIVRIRILVTCWNNIIIMIQFIELMMNPQHLSTSLERIRRLCEFLAWSINYFWNVKIMRSSGFTRGSDMKITNTMIWIMISKLPY